MHYRKAKQPVSKHLKTNSRLIKFRNYKNKKWFFVFDKKKKTFDKGMNKHIAYWLTFIDK